jgi:hypothetical protein
LWGEFAFGEGYFGGTLAQFEVGFLAASMTVYPALDGGIGISAALEGAIELRPEALEV